MKEIFLIRHGETDFNRDGIIQGSGVDIDLNEKGIHQANAFYEYYKNVEFDMVVHSGLKRSYQTVLPFVTNETELVELPEFREISWGVFEGHKYHPELRGAYNELIEAWGEGELNAKLEGGESARELFDRVEEGLHFIKNVQAERILVCSHGRTIRAIMCMAQQLDPSDMEAIHHNNTGLFRMDYIPPEMKVIALNDVSHLELIQV